MMEEVHYATKEYSGIQITVKQCSNGLYSAGFTFFADITPCSDTGRFDTKYEAVQTVCNILLPLANDLLNKPVSRVLKVEMIFAAAEFRKWFTSQIQTLF